MDDIRAQVSLLQSKMQAQETKMEAMRKEISSLKKAGNIIKLSYPGI